MSSNTEIIDRKFNLINRNLQEILGIETLKEILNKRNLRIYWGTATTGKPHIAYFVPIIKIADFLAAGCEIKILLADLHAFLDNVKAPFELLDYRVKYYECVIRAMLESINVSTEKLEFIRGSTYQLSKDYILDVYKLSTIATEHDCKKAGSEVVKQSKQPLLSGTLYPCLQAIDEEYLKVDAQFGGVDQRKIFTFAEKYLPLLNYSKRIHLMNPMVSGLTGNKMSSSDEDSKIELTDSESSVNKKISKAFCEEGNIENNGVLSMCKHVVFPIIDHRNDINEFNIIRTDANGGNISYIDYEKLEYDFKNKLLHPLDLKKNVAIFFNLILKDVRKKLDNDDFNSITQNAYSQTTIKDLVNLNKVNDNNEQKNDENISEPHPHMLDLRVGKIISIEKHSNADSLFIEQIDVGEEKCRTICSGLVEYCNKEELLNSNVVVLCNLKHVTMRGVKSEGMLLAASSVNENGLKVCCKPIAPPSSCKPGDKVWFEFPEKQPLKELNPKKKIFENIKEHLLISKDGLATYKSITMVTSKGPVTSNVINGSIS